MGAESNIRGRVVKALREAGLDAMSVENSALPGTPDVNYVEGWIELKQLPAWPKREETVVLVPKFRPAQRIWLSRRCRKGGQAYFLLRVGNEWLLYKGDVAAQYVGHVTRQEMVQLATRYWPSGLKESELIECLRRA